MSSLWCGLVGILHPDVVLRSDFGAKHRAASVLHRGARAVAGQARGFPGALVTPALVNGAAGAVITVRGRPIAVIGFAVVAGSSRSTPLRTPSGFVGSLPRCWATRRLRPETAVPRELYGASLAYLPNEPP